jgi:hypothetical protein
VLSTQSELVVPKFVTPFKFINERKKNYSCREFLGRFYLTERNRFWRLTDARPSPSPTHRNGRKGAQKSKNRRIFLLKVSFNIKERDNM